MSALAALALVGGIVSCVVGAIAAGISASANMSFDNPLPRAGCAFLVNGIACVAIGIWMLRP